MPKTKLAGHLGHKLAQAIDLKRVQQAEVARFFAVSRPTVSSDWIKHGRIHKRHYPKLVEFFELPYEWWFGSPKRDAVREELLRYYSTLSPESRRALIKAASELRAKEQLGDDIADQHSGHLAGKKAKAA